MNNLTLQINSKEALERLIGGDTKTEIDIRNSVVQKFAEKHLKPIVNSAPVTDTINQIKQHAQKYIAEACVKEIASFKYSFGNYIQDIKLHPEIESIIKSKIKESIDKLIIERVNAAIEQYYNEAVLTKRINVMMDHNIKVLVNEKIKERLDVIKSGL